MRCYHFFILEIIVESVNLMRMSKQNKKLYHHVGEQLGFHKKYISKHKAECSCNLYMAWIFILKRTPNAIFNVKKNDLEGGPQKCSYFSLAITFIKIRKSSRFFLHRYWKFIEFFWCKTTLESIMFYYTFSVINTMFVPCTALLYEQQLKQ